MKESPLTSSINSRLRSAIIGSSSNPKKVDIPAVLEHLQTAYDSKEYYKKQMNNDLKELKKINKLMGSDPSMSTRRKYEKRITKTSTNLRQHLNKFAVDTEVFNRLLILTVGLGIDVHK
jgi:hypothetical protein